MDGPKWNAGRLPSWHRDADPPSMEELVRREVRRQRFEDETREHRKAAEKGHTQPPEKASITWGGTAGTLPQGQRLHPIGAESTPKAAAAPAAARTPPGPKPGGKRRFVAEAWEIAQPILDDPHRRPIRRSGRINITELARMIEPELHAAGYHHSAASIERDLRESVREWEGRRRD